MAIKGSLREASLSDVCQLLALGQKTGCLSVIDRSRFGQIYFQAGRITFATILNRRDRLGDLMVRDGVLNHDQLASAVERQGREPSRRLGELLVELGHADAATVERYIRTQIEDAVYNLMAWREGSFNFVLDQRPPEGEALVSLNTQSILLDGARRTDEWEVIQRKIPSFDLCFQADRERVAAVGIELTPAQETILPLLDGSRSVEDVADLAGLDEFETGKALYGLIQAGLVRRVGKRAASDSPAPQPAIAEHLNLATALYRTGMLDDSATEFRRVLVLQPDHDGARFHLALIDLRQGRYELAAQKLKGLIDEGGERPGPLLNLAAALIGLGRLDEAVPWLDRAEAVRKNDPASALLRGAALLRLERPEAARSSLDDYRRRLAAADVPAAAYFHDAALAAALAGQLDEAADLVREGLDQHPSAAPLLVLAGAIAERREAFDEAVRSYRMAVEASPLLPHTHRNLGDLAYRDGATDSAIEYYRRAIQLAPQLGADVYVRMGDLHHQRLDTEQAIRYWTRALELDPDNREVQERLEEHTGDAA